MGNMELIKEVFPKEWENTKKELNALKRVWCYSFKRAPILTSMYAMLFFAIGIITGLLAHDWVQGSRTNPTNQTPQNQTNFFYLPKPIINTRCQMIADQMKMKMQTLSYAIPYSTVTA